MNKFLKGFVYAWNGIRHASATQLNFRVHLACALAAASAGFALGISAREWLWIILCIGLVLAAELFNTAVEMLTDLVAPQYNKKAGQVKDMAAGAVLLVAMAALLIGLAIFVPKIFALLRHAA